jgi:sirohydrochlorin cobaltochelatase
LVLIGHGSTKNDRSAESVLLQAASLRQRHVFAEVHAAFWKTDPGILDVVAGIQCQTVFLVPFFVSEGYFSEIAIPRLLGFSPFTHPVDRIQNRDGKLLVYTRPVGVHDSVTDVLLARAKEVIDQHPFPVRPANADVSLFVAGHGTQQSSNNRLAIEAHAERIRGRGIYRSVHSVFLEESPEIGCCYQLASTSNIVVVPCFLSDGLHVAEDIPMLLGAPEEVVRRRLASGMPTWRNPTERNGKLVWYSSAIGSENHLPDVILCLVEEAKDWGVSIDQTRAGGDCQ